MLLCNGFDCILRTGELLKMRVCDIFFDHAGSEALIFLGIILTRQRRGAMESVTVTTPLIVKLLRAACCERQRGDFLLQAPRVGFQTQ